MYQKQLIIAKQPMGMGHYIRVTMKRLFFLSLLLANSSCRENSGTFSFTVQTSPDSDLLEQIDKLEIELTDPPKIVSTTRTAGGISLSIDVDADNQQGQVLVRGFNASGDIIATGASPELPIAAIDAELSLFLAPPNSLTEAPTPLPTPLTEAGAAALASTVLLAGGVTSDDSLSDELLFYNFLSFEFSPFLTLPDATKNAHLEASPFGASIFIFGGDTNEGPSSSILAFDFGGIGGGSLSVSDDSALTSPIQGATLLDANRTILSTNPAFSFDHIRRQTTRLTDERDLENAIGARVLNANLESNVFFLKENQGLLLGEDGTFTEIDSPLLENLSGGSLIAISAHQALWLGGTRDGVLTQNGVIYDGRDQSFSLVPNLLSESRSNPTLCVVGQNLLAVGGNDQDEALSRAVDVIDIGNLENTGTMELPEAISGFSLLGMPNGQALVLGGKNEQGAAISQLLVFNP